MLTCPNCKKKLKKVYNSYKCEKNHSFDIAKEGYVNLLLNKKDSGDNLEMIKSRKTFLEKGFYKPLADELINIIKSIPNNEYNIVDVGCGDGYFTNIINQKFKQTIGFDISKDAIKFAAKNYKNITFVVAGGNNLPLADNSVNIILNIFAPHFIDEFVRILKPNSIIIKVTPGRNHLYELKEIIYDEPYQNLEKAIALNVLENKSLTYKINCNQDDLINVFKMTPYYHKTSQKDFEKLFNYKNLILTIDFNIVTYNI